MKRIKKPLKKIAVFVLAMVLAIGNYVGVLSLRGFSDVKVEAKASQQAPQQFANVVLFAHFLDDAETDKAFFADKTNRDKIIDIYNGSSNRSMTNYLKTISYNKFNIVNIFPQDNGTSIESYALPYTKEQARTGNIDYSVIHEMITHLPAITNQELDYNGDGCIDNLTVIVRGGDGKEVPDTTMVCHKSDYPSQETWSGKGIGTYNFLNTNSVMEADLASQAGVVSHEFLHSLGYPDLYNENLEPPVFIWDMMAAVNYGMTYPLAYLRSNFTHWIDIDTITTSQTLTLDTQTNANGNQAYILKSPLNSQELFVVEFRKKGEGLDSLDRFIGPSGVIVYRVDTTVTGLSNHRGKTGIYVFRPQEGQPGYDSFPNTCIYNAALSPEGGRTSIGHADLSKTITDGALTFSDGTNSGIVISEVSSNKNDQVTLKVSIPEASQFDVWKDLNFTSSSLQDWDMDTRTSQLAILNNKVYLTAFENGVLKTYYLNNNQWTQVGSDTSISDLYTMKLKECNGKLYLAYNSGSTIYLNQLDETTGTWNSISTITDYSQTDFDIVGLNGNVYVTYINSAQTGVYLDKVDASGNETQVGSYFTGSTNGFGQPKLAVSGNTLYLTARDWGNLKVGSFTDDQFTEIGGNGLKPNTYDIAAFEGKLYVVMTDGEAKLILNAFDGTTWKNTSSDIICYDPQLVVSQGKLYTLTSPSSGEGRLKVYQFDTTDNSFKKEGEDVDSTGTNLSFVASEDSLYVTYRRDVDKCLVTKVKTTSNPLKSITITPPTKISYKVGETLDTTGMVVVANYLNDSREIGSGYYQITGFSTEAAGTYNATVTYQGVSNTFSYEVQKEAEQVNPLVSITVTPPTKTTYKVGEKLDTKGLKVVANYQTGSNELSSSDYKITGFSTANVGTYNATVTYQGVSNTFSYEVQKEAEQVNPLVSITVTPPTKTTYKVGETLNTSGMKVVANYHSGSKQLSSSDYKITGFSTSNVGTYTATVTYQGMTGKFSYKVENPLVSITVTAPTKTTYKVGESINTSGMKVVANYYSGTKTLSSSDYKITGFSTANVGTYNATVTYQGVKGTFSYKVEKKEEPVINPSNVSYQTHVQDIGWMNNVKNGELSGTTGQSKRLEGIKISLSSQGYDGSIEYRTHIQDIGWESGWKQNGQMSGTSGQSKRLEAIQIRLTGTMAEKFDIYYRVHVQDIGWLDWAKNGDYAGTAGYSYRLEGIQILLVKKGDAAPGPTNKTYMHPMVKYQTHVQDIGWMGNVRDGQLSGTTGQAKRLEGIKITLSNQEYGGSIEYRTHIQDIGWENGWKQNGQMSGTSGQSKRLEAIQIRLTGTMAEKYDIYYQVHVQNFGWLDWAKNGENAGSAGHSYRLEGIRIVIVPKGQSAPGPTNRTFIGK